MDGHHVTTKQKGKVQIKKCDNNRDPFIATSHKVLLTPDLCNRLSSIITLLILGILVYSTKGFALCTLEQRKKNAVTLPHSAQRKYVFIGKIKDIPKKNKLPARKKIALELLHQRLGHRYTRSFLAWDTANFWEDINFRIYPDPLCTSYQISSMIKNDSCKIPLKPKEPFKSVFMDIIPSTSPKFLTSDTTFSNYNLIVDTYSKIPNVYGMEKITTE